MHFWALGNLPIIYWSSAFVVDNKSNMPHSALSYTLTLPLWCPAKTMCLGLLSLLFYTFSIRLFCIVMRGHPRMYGVWPCNKCNKFLAYPWLQRLTPCCRRGKLFCEELSRGKKCVKNATRIRNALWWCAHWEVTWSIDWAVRFSLRRYILSLYDALSLRSQFWF